MPILAQRPPLAQRNQPALDTIRCVIEETYLADDATDRVPTLSMVHEAVVEANEGTGNFSGERSISWKVGAFEHTVTWILAEGRIMGVSVQSVKNGAVKIFRKRKMNIAS